MKIWKQEFTLEGIQAICNRTLVDTFNIKFTEVGDNYLVATMPVTHKNVQPMRILHGGASVALAETVGSIGSALCLEDMTTHQAVGLDINANHLRSVAEGGLVQAKATAVHIGRTTHIWQIDITDEADKLVCTSRLTMMIRKAR